MVAMPLTTEQKIAILGLISAFISVTIASYSLYKAFKTEQMLKKLVR